MAIDYEAVRVAIRTELINAEIVAVTATGELIGIRDGDYNASIHTRPADPATTPIVDSTKIAWEGWEFDPRDEALWYQETLLPSSPVCTSSRCGHPRVPTVTS
jgi:hypothetical protein